jgi:predicted outer membrane repeat protein
MFNQINYLIMKKQLQVFLSMNYGRVLLLAMMIFIGQGAAFSQGTITVTTNADDGAGSLRQAIADAVDGDVINFDPAITAITFNSTLNLGDKTLTIDGGGNVILHREVLALDSFRLVTITGVPDKEVTLTRLTIQNGFSKQHGGGLSADNSTGGKTILDKLIFKNNTAVNNGGGAYVVGLGAYGNIVTNCEFIENKALHITLGRGGALFPKNATITGSTFTKNECGDSGGAIFADNDVAIYDSYFKENKTLDDAGGAIRMQGNNGIVSDCTFESNSAARGGGGALFMAKGRTDNCTFINNSSITEGGAIKANTNGPEIHNSLFIGNSSDTIGGAVYMDDGSVMSNCIVMNNTAAVNGGGVYLKGAAGTGKLIGSIIAHNTADSIGGGVYVGTGNVINSTITKNYAGKNGGALSGNGNWFLANSIVFDNDAAGADKNIQVVSNTAALAAANCAIDATAYNAAGWTATNITTLDASPFVGGTGADSLMVPYSSALIDAGTTDHGVADLLPATDLNGGNRIINGVVDLGPYERLQSFVVTTDADDGAGSLRQMIADAVDGESIITFADGITSIKVGMPLELGDKTLIIDGEGDVILDGALTGAVETDIYRVVTITGAPGKQVTIKNLTIQNGLANGANGGGLSAVHSAGGQTILDGLTFQNNVANGSGGAVSIIGYNMDTLCIINNCEFIGNKTNEGNNFNGGGVNADYTEISGCTFIDNESGYNAGALVMSRVFVYDSHFEGNTSLSSGGAARIGNVAGTITNSTFHANSSVGNGGAVFMARGNLYNCEFTSNSGTEGGAVYANQNECIIDHCTFSENSASTNGGAVWIDDAGKMTNSIVTNNSAALVGGGVYIRLGGSAIGSVLAYNTADSIGGGIHVVNAKVINTIITKNYAGKNGGALSGNGNWFLANSIVFDNDAAGDNKNIQVVSNTAATAAANSAIDATAYNAAAWTATNIITLDASPFVGGTGADSLYSLISSGLIDAGTLDYGIEALLPATDLDGNDRIQGVIDMGVYETSIIGVLGVTLDRSSLRLITGSTGTLVATVEPDFATDKSVTWSSSNESIATVADGVVTAVSDGTATITVTTVNGGFTATCNVTVYTPVTGVSLNEEAITLEVSETFTLVATITPAGATDQTVGWVSGNQSVATVNNSGLVTAVSAGTATISVVTVDGSFIATCDVTVIEPSIAVTGVSLDQATLALEPGNTATLVATVAPGDATDKSVSWTSSNEAVATVADGVVTAVADGTCTITVTTTDGGFTATCDVTVETVGLKHFEAGFTIYPNPVRNNIFIEGENIHSITIYSLTGAPVMIVEEGFSKGINVASMESGMYILKIKTDKGTGVTTIVKE